MGKATQEKKNVKAEATGKTETKKSATTERSAGAVIVSVKQGALSLDVGPTVLAGLASTFKDEEKMLELQRGIESKRYDLLAQTTNAIIKAATADDTIDLSAAFSGDSKKMKVLNDQLGLALGFREVSVLPATKEGGPEVKRISWAKAVSKYFPTAKDTNKESPEYKRKDTLRSNFLHMVKKCAQAANGIMVSDAKVTVDKESGTLQLSGPAIQEKFGQETVLLNEKQVIGEGEAKVKLAAKPSYTAVAAMGAEAAGKVMQTRKDSRVASNAVDPATAVKSIAKSLADACGKLKLPADDETKRALSIAQNAIDKVLSAK
jgi:hypothetical protein